MITFIIGLAQSAVGTKPTVMIQSVTFFDTIITDSLYLVSHALQPLVTQTTVPYIPKRATEVAASYFSDLLTFTNNMSLARRTAALARLLHAIEPLLSLQVIGTLVLPQYLCKLLMRRLRDGPQPAWDRVDDHLAQALDTIPHGTRLGVENTWLQEALNNHNWEDETESKLRVSPNYHHYCCRHRYYHF